MTLKSVVLPDPLGPIKAVILLVDNSKEILSRAWIPPKYFETFLTFKIGVVFCYLAYFKK